MKNLIAAALVIALTACSSIDLKAPNVQFIIQYATLRFVQTETGLDPQKIKVVMDGVKLVRSRLGFFDENVDALSIESILLMKADEADLLPADKLALKALIGAVSLELDQQLSDVEPSQRIIVIQDAVDLVEQTLAPYAI